jgi:hypothetical protein
VAETPASRSDPHQEAFFTECMLITDGRSGGGPAARCAVPAADAGDRCSASRAVALARHIGILAVRENRGREPAVDGNIVDHPPAVEGRRRAGSEDIFGRS